MEFLHVCVSQESELIEGVDEEEKDHLADSPVSEDKPKIQVSHSGNTDLLCTTAVD